MEKIYEGKTKTVYQVDAQTNRLLFKDDVTGTDGVFDPGANTVGLQIKDNGLYGLALSTYFFEKIEQAGIRTHFISADLTARTMDVLPVRFFGQGIEVISRYKAMGSFIRRFGQYAVEGLELPCFVEISLKDDERGDPFISAELLSFFDITTITEHDTLVEMTKAISEILKQALAAKNLELIDLKLEFGKDTDGKIVLIDEISGGNMRVFKDGVGITPIEVAQIMLEGTTLEV